VKPIALLALASAIAFATSLAALPGSVTLVPVASGFQEPMMVTNAGDGSDRLYVVERTGKVRIVDGGGPGVHTTLIDLPGPMITGGERGFLGFAFHPAYDGISERRFYVHYSASSSSPEFDNISTVSMFQTEPGSPEVANLTETVLLEVGQPADNHNGGSIAFGTEIPNAHLYIGIGDGGDSNDTGTGHTPVIGNAQDTTNSLGAILRIDVDSAPDPGLAYHIPATNPFAGSVVSAEEIYAWGVRNPYRFSFDRGTGLLLCGDVGQFAWEEVDIIGLGENMGWRNYEGNNTVLGPTIGGTTFPIHEYFQSGLRCSIIGGYVYRGVESPTLLGHYIFGDYCTGEIFSLEETTPGVWSSTSTVIANLATTFDLVGFGEDEDGEIYVCNNGTGEIFRIVEVPVPADLSILGVD
jgi:glucose/arabinose dehydrogenase